MKVAKIMSFLAFAGFLLAFARISYSYTIGSFIIYEVKNMYKIDFCWDFLSDLLEDKIRIFAR